MLLSLISHYFKFEFRKSKFDSGLILKIAVFASFIYLCLTVFYLSVNFSYILTSYRPEANPVTYFNYILLYLLSIDFIVRFFTQSQTFIHSKAYFHLPIPRKTIFLNNLMLILLNINNLYISLLVIPFIVGVFYPVFGWGTTLLYSVTFFLMILFLSLFTSLVKYLIQRSLLYISIPVIWAGYIITQHKIFHSVLELNNLNIVFREGLLWAALVLLTVNVSLVYANLVLMKAHFYKSDSRSLSYLDKINFDLGFFSNSHLTYLLLEIRLFLRNKRLRSILIVPLFIGLLTLYVFSKTRDIDPYSQLFWFTCLNGALGYSYAQFMFSWEGNYFDFISSNPFSFVKSLLAKYFLCIAGGIVVTLAVTAFVTHSNIDFPVMLTAILYNSGFGYFFTFFTSTFNNKRMDLDSGIFFNTQGYDNIQLLSISLVTILPMLFLYLLRQLFSQPLSLFILDLICVISIFKIGYWMQVIHEQLLRRKYINLEGYRK